MPGLFLKGSILAAPCISGTDSLVRALGPEQILVNNHPVDGPLPGMASNGEWDGEYGETDD